MKNYIDWNKIYKQPALFHVYITERGRGKSDTKGWQLLEIITTTSNNVAWIRRRWHDSLVASKPFFQKLVYEFCEEKKIDRSQFEIIINESQFETKEQGVFYRGKIRIHFIDLFSFERLKSAITRTIFQEIVFEEAIPIDQEFLPGEQFKFRDLIKSLKGRTGKDKKPIQTKITFLANPNSWSAWLLSVFEETGQLFPAKKEAEEKKVKNDNSGVLETVKDKKGVEWFLYLNLIEGEEDPHYSALEERTNPSLQNWDNFMISIYTKNQTLKKYQIKHAIQDYFFIELGERKKNRQWALMHFTRNQKETNQELVNFCFNLAEKAKSKLKNCVIREKQPLLNKWVNMLKEQMLYFTDYRSRDWFLEMIK